MFGMKYDKWGPLALIVVYLVGIIGVSIPLYGEFMRLTPLNLLFSVFILAIGEKKWSLPKSIALIMIGIGGWAVEWWGIKTGFPFGNYHYGPTLGPAVDGVPLTMALNWVMLVYCCSAVFHQSHPLKAAALGATIMLSLDIIIEPVAIKYAFWFWDELGFYPPLLVAPIGNYIAWWFLGFAFIYLYNMVAKPSANPVAFTLLACQYIFFSILATTSILSS